MAQGSGKLCRSLARRGGHTVSKQGLFNYGQDIVMAFLPPVLGSLVKTGLQKGGSQAPEDIPWLRPCHDA